MCQPLNAGTVFDTVTFTIRVYLWVIIKDENYSNNKQCKCLVGLATTKHYSDIKYYIAVKDWHENILLTIWKNVLKGKLKYSLRILYS